MTENKVSLESKCRQRLFDVESRCPTVFGRLLAVSELRNPVSGRYEHYHAREYRSDTVDRVLREMHRGIFMEWLMLSLEEQEQDLSAWLSWLGHSTEASSRLLHRMLWQLSSLMPQGYALRPEGLLFAEDLEMIVSLICRSSAKGRFLPSEDSITANPRAFMRLTFE